MKKEYRPHAENPFLADELLNCPFCGSDAELHFRGNPFTKRRLVTIKCKKCLVEKRVGAIYESAQWCAETAIKDWNKRITNKTKY